MSYENEAGDRTIGRGLGSCGVLPSFLPSFLPYAQGEGCVCHYGSPPVEHEILSANPICVPGDLNVTVHKASSPTDLHFSATAGGQKLLGYYDASDVSSLSFQFRCEDLDSDVCEPGQYDLCAILRGVATNPPTLVVKRAEFGIETEIERVEFLQEDGVWSASWDCGGIPGVYVYELTGIIEDRCDNHPDSDDQDLTLSGYRSWILLFLADLDVDTDRDGSVEKDDDDLHEDSFTAGRGAVILANRDRDNQGNFADCDDTMINMGQDLGEISRMVVQGSGIDALPSDLRAVLRIPKEQADKIRIFFRAVLGVPEILGPTTGHETADGFKECTLPSSWVEGSGGRTLGCEALQYIGEESGFDGALHVWLVYQASGAGGSWVDVSGDEVLLQVAPCVLSWNGQTAEVVYDAWEIHDEISAILSISVIRSTDTTPFSPWPWLQDYAEIVNTKHANGRRIPGIVDLNHDKDKEWPHKVWLDDSVYGYIERGTGGEGGNIETSPPLSEYPLGRIVLGNSLQHANNSLNKFVNAQRVQVPTIDLDTSWLEVGHVDEVVSFVPAGSGFAVLVPSPRVAVNLLHVFFKNGLGDTTMRVGAGGSSHTVKVKEILVRQNGDAAATLAVAMNHTTPTMTLLSQKFVPGDMLRVQNEYMRVQAVSDLTVTVFRGQLQSTPSSHPSDSLAYALSDLARENLDQYEGTPGYILPGPQTCIDSSVLQLQNELVPDDPSSLAVIELPVIFGRFGGKRFLAYTPNLVNCLVAQGKAIMCDPLGPKVKDVDYFRHYAAQKVGACLNPAFVNGWALHVSSGEIHCGSNTRRRELSIPWWQAWK